MAPVYREGVKVKEVRLGLNPVCSVSPCCVELTDISKMVSELHYGKVNLFKLEISELISGRFPLSSVLVSSFIYTEPMFSIRKVNHSNELIHLELFHCVYKMGVCH